MAFRGGPGAEGESRVRVIGRSLGPIAVTKQSGGALLHAKYIIKPAGIKGYEKTRMRITKIRKNKAVICSHYTRGNRIQDRGDAPQPGGPYAEGPADWKYVRIQKDARNWMVSFQ